ncbi:MAG: hypothetical protein SOY64_06455, partial [Pyramidobacter sp.]
MNGTVRVKELLRRRLGRRAALFLALAAGAAGADVGRAVVVTGDQLNVGENNTLGAEAYVVIGKDAKATGRQAIALGDTATASGDHAVAIGQGATADYHAFALGSGANAVSYSLAFGRNATAGQQYALAIGEGANAGGRYSTAVGRNATASGEGSLAFGNDVNAAANYSLSIGSSAAASAGWGLAVGYKTKASGTRSTAIGVEAKAESHESLALGYKATASNSESVAIGKNANAASWKSIAIGLSAATQGQYTTAIGPGTVAGGDSSVAMGYNAKTESFATIAFGLAATASGRDSIAIGSGAEADGGASVTAAALALGKNAKANGEGSVAIGSNAEAGAAAAVALGRATIASGSGSFAAGEWTQASGHRSVALGYRSQATAESSFAFGIDADSAGHYSIALGRQTKTAGTYSIALGTSSGAFGEASVATGRYSAAVGRDSLASSGGFTAQDAAHSFAVGDKAAALLKDSVALGSGAVANTAAGKAAYLANGRQTPEWKSTRNAVAVGNGALHTYESTTWAGATTSVNAPVLTRQITGVAGGTEDTDAVNVAQLKRAQADYLSVNDGGTQGGNYNNDGALMDGSMAVGKDSKAYLNSVAVGMGAVAHGRKIDESTYNNLPPAMQADYVMYSEGGVHSYYHKDGGVAFGRGVRADGSNSLAVGTDISNVHGIAIGVALSNIQGVVIGGGMTNITGGIAVVGNGNKVTHGLAFGQGNEVVGDQDNGYDKGYSIAIGNWNTAKVTTPGDGAGSVAIGEKVEATGYRSLGIGMVNGSDGGLNPQHTKATGDDAIAIGTYAEATAKETVAVGRETVASGSAAIAVGFNSKASANDAVALGSGAQATAEKTIAIGYRNVVSGTRSTAIGDPNNITGTDSQVLGNDNTISGNNSAAIGNNNTVTSGHTYVLGSGVTAGVENSVVLGSGSTVEAKVGTAGASINGKAYTFAGGAPYGTISVGSAGGERTVTHVAAGRIAANSTDAVNGSQLWSTNDNLERVKKEADGNLAALGGGAAYDIDANAYTTPTYSVTDGSGGPATVHTVSEAVDALGRGWKLKDGAAGEKVVKAGNEVKVTGDSYIQTAVNGAGLALTLNAANLNTAITNQIANNPTVTQHGTDITALKAGFTVSNEAGTKQDITLGGPTKKNIQFKGEANKILVEVANAADGATVTVKADPNLGTNLDITHNPAITSLSAGFKVKAGTSEGPIVAGNTLEFAGKNYVEAEYDSAAKKMTIGLDDATKNKIDNLGASIGAAAKWTIQDDNPVQGSKQIDAAHPLTVKGENGVTTKVDANGLTIGLNG